MYTETSTAQEAYNNAYYELSNLMTVERDSYVSAEKNEDNYDQRVAYNDALEEYNDAKEDSDKALTKYKEYDVTDPFMAGFFKVLGIIIILAGIVWMLIKKFAFDKEGEAMVDEEIAIKMEEAKQKGLEKLNIVSSQINYVEPVVLNGIADPNDKDVVAPRSIKSVLRRLFRIVVLYGKIILGIVCAALVMIVGNLMASWGWPMWLISLFAFAVAGAIGFLTYKKYETESFVNPKTIDDLKKLPPKLILKLGSDDRVRASLPAIAVYMFGEDQLYVYYQYLDIVTGKLFCEGVHEYFYEDIVGITSRQDTKIMFKRYGFLNLFVKSVDYLAESITVATSGGTHSESYIVDIGNSLLDTQFTGMRNLIRQKKNEQ